MLLAVVACGSTVDPHAAAVTTVAPSTTDQDLAALPSAPKPVITRLDMAQSTTVLDDGLAVQIVGLVEDDRICPGGQRPCIPLGSSVATDENDVAHLSGRLVDGALVVDEELPVPGFRPSFVDRCDDKASTSQGDPDVQNQLFGYQATIPATYATIWTSPTKVLHLGVVGDTADHVNALDKLGIGPYVCVVGGFSHSMADLEANQVEIGNLINQWRETRLLGSGVWGPDPFEGINQIELYRVDSEMSADVEERFGDAVVIRASITVLDGNFADLDTALAQISSALKPVLEARCGGILFSSIPADLGEFPPLDDEAQEAIDRARSLAAVEGTIFDAPATWSIASRTDTTLILLGQRIESNDPDVLEHPLVFAEFTRNSAVWSDYGSGACTIRVSATGLSSTRIVLDPDRQPDETSEQLPILMMEQNCAGGEAPVGREIVPIVTETETTVELTVLVAPIKGGATCPSNPWHPLIIELEQPLGDRTVIAAGTYPPLELTWPPDSDLLRP